MDEQRASERLTAEEKVALQTGDGAWNTHAFLQKGVSSIRMSDGPLGLRKEQDGAIVPAVCFPSPSRIACSFDPSLARDLGQALGEQCVAEQVDVLLAPGINVKRTPLCGRNFEYFSEDPLLTAEMACGYIEGVQSQGVGCCVKHFACNNQEYGRYVCDSVVDDRALREIYLSAFERVIKNAKPSMVMCSYNRLNGEYCSQSKFLLTDLLRDEWGFEGVAVSDWGATDDRVKGICAGLDLEMPQGDTSDVARALQNGTLSEAELDRAVDRIAELSEKFTRKQAGLDKNKQHKLAARLAEESLVLVKNSCDLLPLATTDDIAVIGRLAEQPVYQGEGSAHVNAYKPDSLLQALAESKVTFEYAQGYGDGNKDDAELLERAIAVAERHSRVILVVGAAADAEAFDRQWSLPQNQLRVIEAVSAACPNVVVVLQCGAATDVRWVNGVKALLIDYYGGEASGRALCNVLFGKAAPSGRLAESWPLSLPRWQQGVGADFRQVQYVESGFVGYRYYATANCPVAFPFGYGLGYGKIEWSDVAVSQPDKKGKIKVKLTLTNKSDVKQAEVVQLYYRNDDGRGFYPRKNLAAFRKVKLGVGQARSVTLEINVKQFASYDTANGWSVNGGKYTLWAARHVNDEAFPLSVTVDGENNTVDLSAELPAYYNVDEDFCPTQKQFEQLLGREIVLPHSNIITVSTPLCEVTHTLIGRIMFKKAVEIGKQYPVSFLRILPLRMLVCDELSREMLVALIACMNKPSPKNIVKCLKAVLKHRKERKRAAEVADLADN